ncbi:MAG: peptidoglycan DD-metalloendopeptidase family protein [Oscillospiraceae bacterium]
MKNNRSHKNISGKGLAIASAIGICAVGAAMITAYNSAMQRLIPTSTQTSSTSTWVFTPETSADAAEEVNNSAAGVPFETEDAAAVNAPAETEDAEIEEAGEAEEANKPISAEIGNIMPVDGEVSHPFSNGELVKSETLGVWKTHDGCDILCELGTDVKSASEGVVKEIKNDPLWGVCVIVDQSNGLEVHYCGLAKELNVKAGQQVKQGELIGKTSDTCQCEIVQKPHLHLGIKQGGKWIDPMSVMDNSQGE